VWTERGATRGPASSQHTRLKRAMTSAGPLLRSSYDGAWASAVRKPLRERSRTGLACRSNSSNRWCASSRLSVSARTRSVAAAKAAWGDQEREGGEVEVEEELRRSGRRRDIGVLE
jgi:hypothetical protein